MVLCANTQPRSWWAAHVCFKRRPASCEIRAEEPTGDLVGFFSGERRNDGNLENKNEEEEWRKFPLAVYLCRYLSGYSVMEAGSAITARVSVECQLRAIVVCQGDWPGTTETQLRSEVDGQYQGFYYILKGFLEYNLGVNVNFFVKLYAFSGRDF